MIVTQIPGSCRHCCSNLVLRRAPRLHTMKLRQHDLRSWSCWLLNAGNHPSVKTARKGTLHKKEQLHGELLFFVVLTGGVFPCYIAQRYRFVTQPAASCLASGNALVLQFKFDFFCHLSIFFLTFAPPPTLQSAAIWSMMVLPQTESRNCPCVLTESA